MAPGQMRKGGVCGQHVSCGVRELWLLIKALLGKRLNFSEPQFPHL